MTAKAIETGSRPGSETAGIASVDQRAPRFGQSMTAVGLAGAAILAAPLLLYATTVVLVAAVASRWRLDLYATVWRRVLLPFIGRPTSGEPAAPHRFARVLGAIGASAASLLVVFGFPLVGYAVAGAVATLAAVAAVTGFCLGCRLYRQVSVLGRYEIV